MSQARVAKFVAVMACETTNQVFAWHAAVVGSIWDGINWADLPPTPESEADYAALRILGRTTVGRSFSLRFGSRADVGQPARTVWQVIAEDADYAPGSTEGFDVEDVMVHQSAGGRVQVKARVVREQGRVTELRFERLRGAAGVDASVDRILTPRWPSDGPPHQSVPCPTRS